MAVAISTANVAERIWSAPRRLYRPLAERALAEAGGGADIAHQLHMAEVVNGVSLHDLYEKKPDLALRLRNVLAAAAAALAERTFTPEELEQDFEGARPEVLKQRYTELHSLLARWTPG